MAREKASFLYFLNVFFINTMDDFFSTKSELVGGTYTTNDLRDILLEGINDILNPPKFSGQGYMNKVLSSNRYWSTHIATVIANAILTVFTLGTVPLVKWAYTGSPFFYHETASIGKLRAAKDKLEEVFAEQSKEIVSFV